MTTKIYKAGARLKSAVSEAQIMVLRVPAVALDLRCFGQPLLGMAEVADGAAVPDAAFDGAVLSGKRYVDAAETMEFLCTKGGQGTLSVDGVALGVKQAKALPSSD
jgi:hypothetical protein